MLWQDSGEIVSVVRKSDVHYRYKIPTSITVEVDTRERKPVKFPAAIKIVHPEDSAKRLLVRVTTRRVKLPYGDYRLAEYPECCVIERKAGQRELFKNIFNPRDSVRQAKSFRKLSGCEYPYVMIELTPAEILRRNPHVPDAEALFHKLSLVFAKYGFNVLWIPWRSRKTTGKRHLGQFLLHTMLACGLNKTFDVLPGIIGE